MTYIPEHQYRCTIIRGKSQNDMEDMLPLYADIVHRNCPCTKNEFVERARKRLSKALFETEAFASLSESNLKTVDNHLTEIAGTLLGLYYYDYDEDANDEIAYETEACKFILEKGDNPTFFKNLCLNFQFPNAAKWKMFVLEDLKNEINIKPFCFVVSLLYYAQMQPQKELLTKQEVGYYVLNNLDVLQGKVKAEVVYNRIMEDRKNKVRRERLSGSNAWQHIKEQFNLLELANIIETDATYLWLNKEETTAIKIFLNHLDTDLFDVKSYKSVIETPEGWRTLLSEWRKYYGSFNKELEGLETQFNGEIVIAGREEQAAHGGATKSSVDIGDDGEALVFRLEQERVRNYKERLVNKVLLLGKTKGLGYDISSIEANENPQKPEFARYIEVKSTKRVTEPSFNKEWLDSLNITAKEWVAAEQYGEYYNIYRVYFTKNKTIIVRMQNPFKKYQDNEIEVYPTIYQMNFGAEVIEKRYEGE